MGPSSRPAPSPGSTNQAGVRSCSRYRIDIKSAPAMTYWQGDWWSRSRSRQRSKECHFRPPRTFGNGSGVPLAESQEALPGTSAQGRTIFVSTVVSSAFVLCVVLPLDPAALRRTGRKLQRQMAAARAEIAPSQARRVRQARRGEPQLSWPSPCLIASVVSRIGEVVQSVVVTGVVESGPPIMRSRALDDNCLRYSAVVRQG